MRTLILIDANSLIHRCFHALPPFTGPNGIPTGSLYGLSNVLLKILREQAPNYIAAFFDRPEPTFRKEMFEEYKIHRPKAPDELVSQIIEAHHLFEAFGIKTYEIPGLEGDDLIASAASNFKKTPDLKIIILTGDLDMLQLVENGKVMVETFKKGVSETIIYNEEGVKERYEGIEPKQMADYKSLVGDKSDNILGVPGIGPKTAVPVIKEYKTLENFLANGQLDKNYLKITKFKDQALMSKKLATLRADANFNIKDISELEYKRLPKENLVSYFDKLGFKSLINRINTLP
jgi:DNA polymerase-1